MSDDANKKNIPPAKTATKRPAPGFSRVPGAKPAVINKDPEAFIEGAGKPDPALVADTEPLPWEGLDDKKRREPFNVRFTDVEKEMLKYIEKNGRDSMHAFCVSVLRPALIAKVSEMSGRDFSELLDNT